MKVNYRIAALLSSACVLAIASAADAQTTQASALAAAPTAAQAPAAASEIIVTGSRVIKNGNNSPTPVTIVGTDELMALQPTTLTDALNNLPVFQGSRGQFSNPNTTGIYGGGNPASNELNLRNLGPQRTLVLFDGQRVPPSNAIGIPDVDTIPEILIQRVDIVTGGVSAVYGSDAIAGVVNYVTDKHFNGVKAEASYGVSDRSDDESWKVAFAGGTKVLDDKGHVEFSYEHYNDAGIPRRSERNYYQYALLGSVPGSTTAPGTAANPYEVFNGVTINSSSFGGLITNGPLKGQNFTTNGALSAFNKGIATGTSNSQIGGDGSYGGQSSLAAPMHFDQAFGRFDYDFTPDLRFHSEISGTWKNSYTNSADTILTNYTFNSQNAFLSPAVRAALAAVPTFTMSEALNDLPQVQQISNVKNYFANGGLEGKLGKFEWGSDFDYGYNSIEDTLKNNVNNQRLAAALDAVVNPATGQIVCNASLTNSAYSNCVPLNIFGSTAASPAAASYVTGTTHYNPQFSTIEANAHISGEIFNLPAGPLNASLSGEFRKETFSDTSDAIPTLPSCTSLRYNCTAKTALWTNAFANSSSVSQTVKEGALEFDAPLLKDLPLVQSLNLNGAARFTSYDFGGNNWTWKIGLDWHLTDEYTIRATVSQDIEAPSLSELFQPTVVSPVSMQDRLTLTTPAINVVNIGNPNLVSEVGHTITAGFVWKPHFIPGFSMSLDGYHIKIDKALTQLQGYNPQLQDACYASKGTSIYCTLQTRALGFTNTTAANAVTEWTAVFANIANIETYGADLEVNYATRLWEHSLSTRVFGTWQPHYYISQPGVPTYDEGNVAFPNVVPLQAIPALRLTATANFGVTDNFFIGVTERYRGSMKASAVPTDVYVAGDRRVNSISYTDFNLIYRLKAGNELYLNVRNAFDQMPQGVAGLSSGAGYPGIDDPIGRYYTVGIRVRM